MKGNDLPWGMHCCLSYGRGWGSAFCMRYKCATNFESCTKRKSGTPLFTGIPDFSERCLADSNRRGRFCRPLTKPLIQGTKFWNDRSAFSNAGAKVASFFETTKFFCYFFVQQHDFFRFSHSFALSFSSFSWHPVHPSHGSSLFRIRSYTHQAAYPTAPIRMI